MINIILTDDLEEARDLMSWAYMAIIVAGICYLTLLTCRSMLILEGAVLLQFIAGMYDIEHMGNCGLMPGKHHIRRPKSFI